MARRGVRDVADVLTGGWDAFGRGGGSEAWMDGAVIGLALAVTDGLASGWVGGEREAAALMGEFVPFHALSTCDLEGVAGRGESGPCASGEDVPDW